MVDFIIMKSDGTKIERLAEIDPSNVYSMILTAIEVDSKVPLSVVVPSKEVAEPYGASSLFALASRLRLHKVQVISDGEPALVALCEQVKEIMSKKGMEPDYRKAPMHSS